MVQVRLGSTLGLAAGGRTEFSVEARNVMQMLEALGESYPELRDVLDRGVAVAIDGRIYRDSWLQKIPPGAQVTLMPKLAGG